MTRTRIFSLPRRTSSLRGDDGAVLVEYAIMTWVWVLMARLNRSGKTWARIVASVLFALWTFNIYSVVNSLRAGQVITVADIIYIILVVGIWLAGLGAIQLLSMDRFEPWQKLKAEQAAEGESHLALSVRIDVVFLDLHLCIVA